MPSGLSIGPRPARAPLPRLSSARASVLRTLIAAGDAVTVSELAQQLGQHSNTVREHLDALAADGRVERIRSAPEGRGRPAWLYRAAQDSAENPTSGDLLGGPLGTDGQEYVALAVALIDQVSSSSPDPTELARKAGERWGRTLAEDRMLTGNVDTLSTATANDAVDPVGTVLDMLRDLRFAPQKTDDPAVVKLTTCPFLDAARRHPEVVCQIHLGIMRGALQQLGADPNGVDLRAFATPGACLLTMPDSR